MKDKKHIDELFKDRFKDFDATPPPEVWANIQAQLKKEKEDRKVIPIWWKVAGVAALLALLLTVGNSVFDFGNSPTELTEENIDLPENTDSEKINPLIKNEADRSEVATEKDSEKTKDLDDNKKVISDDKSKDAVFNKDKTTDEAVVSLENANKPKNTSNKDLIVKDKVISNAVSNKKDAVAVSSEKNTSEKVTTKVDSEKNKITEKINSEKVAVNKTIDSEKNKNDNPNNDLLKKELQIPQTVDTEAVAVEKKKQEEKAKQEEAAKKSIFDAIEETKTEEAVVKNTAPDKRWEVSPNVGPVYYSSFGNGSSLDPSFADNAQSGDVNFSYGAGVSYAITDKLSVRSGISNVNLSYTTADVELGTGPVSSALKSVDYGGRQIVVTAVDKGALQTGGQENGPFGNITPKAGAADAFINQSIRYYEVPMELKYALVDNKFGINMIGGFSTLFLGSNEVSVNAGDFNTVLGEANNLNSLSFTTNIGLGFNYKITKRLKFNIEPMFKYQLNPYSDSSVDFNPFYMGVYTGFSFKF